MPDVAARAAWMRRSSAAKSRADSSASSFALRQRRPRRVESLGRAPPVFDGEQFLQDPAGHLRAMCAASGVAYTPRMLHWPAGPHPDDGVWAPHWYAVVWRSTGFESWQPRAALLDDAGRRVADTCRPAYERLRAHAIGAAGAEDAEGGKTAV